MQVLGQGLATQLVVQGWETLLVQGWETQLVVVQG
jgi:hypothetical protein